jgi:hypothetical protein
MGVPTNNPGTGIGPRPSADLVAQLIAALKEATLDAERAKIRANATAVETKRELEAILATTLARSGLDRSLCRCCGKLVFCIPDGLSNFCVPCSEAETAREAAV